MAELSSAPPGSPATLQFCDVQWHMEITTFWDRVRELKLHTWQRGEPCVATRGTITVVVKPVDRSEPPNVVFFNGASLLGPQCESITRGVDNAAAAPVIECEVPGTLVNTNSKEVFERSKPNHVLQHAIWAELFAPLLTATDDKASEAWRTAPYLLSTLRAFADVKNHTYLHRAAFPAAFLRGSPWRVAQSHLGYGHGCALDEDSQQRICAYLRESLPHNTSHPFAPVLCQWAPELTMEPLTPRRWEACWCDTTATRPPLIACHDISSVPGILGWPMLNLLTCLRVACPDATERVSIYAVRQGSPGSSLSLELVCDPLTAAPRASLEALRTSSSLAPDFPAALFSDLFAVTGCCSKTPLVHDLSRDRDPARRAHEDSILNLRLMRWQQQPDLQLERLSGCRALLLGAGTLGCHTARNLLCWGVRHITLVDRGRVSFSNLARQSLFTLASAAEHVSKATAAAAALNDIIPSPHITGVDMSIPMPGHRADTAKGEDVAQQVEALAQLIQSHDVVFLLTDSREARWLPTVLAASLGVPVINAALSFGGYEVQRHGLVRAEVSASNAVPHPAPADAAAEGREMGCYFCNKMVPILNSTAFRALDQQCTVTRPGVSPIASAVATELLAALYQHPHGFLCPHSTDPRGTPLGAVPQMVMGDVGGFNTMRIACKRDVCCAACSEAVLAGYAAGGTDFLVHCINDSDYLDTVCGMKALRAQWEERMQRENPFLCLNATTGEPDEDDAVEFIAI